MKIIWYGHSCFLLKTCNGKRILMDPFDDSLGYDNKFPKCDVITISHSHFDHSYLNTDNNDTKVINTCGFFDLDYAKILGIECFHDEYEGLKRGPNIIYLITIDNISICHLGDLGHIPCTSILNKLKKIDILLIPIGGQFTLDGIAAAKLCNILCPKIIIPMHYKTNTTALQLDDCKNFILNSKNIEKFKSNTIDISSINYNNNCQTILLKPPIS